MSKRLGQNFLINRHQRERILETLGVLPGCKVWEIGPGIGSMTALAVDAGIDLTAFEIDHGFARILARIFEGKQNFRLVEGDFLDTWQNTIAEGCAPDRIFGNLPYNVASAIIAVILEEGRIPGRMVFTVQKEAAVRMAAKPGTKDYSAFSILCTSACKIKMAFDLGASSFWPAPNVTSTVVTFVPRTDPVMAHDRKGFSTFVRAGFSSRRKTLRNNLKSWGGMNGLVKGIVPDVGDRPHEEVRPYEEVRPEKRGSPDQRDQRDKQEAMEARNASDEIVIALLAKIGKKPDIRAEALLPEELAHIYEGLKAES